MKLLAQGHSWEKGLGGIGGLSGSRRGFWKNLPQPFLETVRPVPQGSLHLLEGHAGNGDPRALL